jgi:hypothetical protein
VIERNCSSKLTLLSQAPLDLHYDHMYFWKLSQMLNLLYASPPLSFLLTVLEKNTDIPSANLPFGKSLNKDSGYVASWINFAPPFLAGH